jgi:hypothetical protein
MKVDFTNGDFEFVSKPGEWFEEGSKVQCEGDFTSWRDFMKVCDGWGLFRGMTMERYEGYTGELPRIDGETSQFSDFQIFYKGEDVSQMNYGELRSLVTQDKRDEKIEDLGI